MAKRTMCPKCGKGILDVRRYHLDELAALMVDTINGACISLGVSGSTQKDARCHGISRDYAERLAVKAGHHPWTVWPEMADHDLADHQRECGAPDCTERFMGHPNRVYCSQQCRRRTQAARYRARHPEVYAERLRRWKAKNADEVREYNRRYQRHWMRARRAKLKEQAA